MLHPAIAHFGVVLPLLSLILGIAYLIKPSELMSKISSRFMVFASIFLVLAFFTGKEDGGEVYILLTSEGQATLLQHKDLGLYLAISMVFATLVKLYGCFKNKIKIELFSVVLVAIIAAGVLYQGKIGGDLTYIHGAHVEKHSDGMDCLADPDDFMGEDDEDEEDDE